MTEKEKMLAGEYYNAMCSDLIAERELAGELLYEFNLLQPSMKEKHTELIRQLFGSVKENFTIVRPFFCDYGYNIHIGNNFFANTNCTFLDEARITIGDNVLLGPNVGLYTAEHPHDIERRNKAIEYSRPITIGNNVWIAGGVTIVGGVTIGDNAVIGAGSVVTRNIPANVVAVGNPCRAIKEIPDSSSIF